MMKVVAVGRAETFAFVLIPTFRQLCALLLLSILNWQRNSDSVYEI